MLMKQNINNDVPKDSPIALLSRGPRDRSVTLGQRPLAVENHYIVLSM